MQVTDDMGKGDELSPETPDEWRAFAALTLDCLALSRAMLDSTDDLDDDQLELLRRRRLMNEIEAAVGDRWAIRGGTAGTG